MPETMKRTPTKSLPERSCAFIVGKEFDD